MNKIKIAAIFILLLITRHSFGQKELQLDSVFLNKISKQVKDEMLNSYKNDSISIKGDCYYEDINGNKWRLSCFSVSWNFKWIGDINNDNEDDIVLYVFDDGLGGGGNAFGYYYYVIYLKDKKIIKTDTIFGGGKFSYAHLNVDSVSNNTIYARLTENTFFNHHTDSTQEKEINLRFIWNNNRLVEKSYINCPFMSMDKRIFSPKIVGVKRRLRLNDLYEEIQNEWLSINNKSIYTSFTGCKTLELTFSIERPFDEKLDRDSLYKKSELLKELTFLKDNTQFDSLFESINLDIEKNGLFLHKTKRLPNGWSYDIAISSYTYKNKKVSEIRIELINKKTDEIKPNFWEKIKR